MSTQINQLFTISPALTGFTGPITNFQFSFAFASLSGITFDTSKALWSFGDGTFSTDVSTSHVYNWPGVYEVGLKIYDADGQVYNSIYTQSITARNLLNDSLEPYPKNKIVNVMAGRISSPLRCSRVNSWQSYRALSAAGYTFNLYCSGSLSEKLNLNTLETNKWAHIERTWRFVEKVIDNFGNTQYLPIDSIATTNELIYYVYNSTTGTATHVPSTYPGSVFVGTSGSAEFYFIDDTPKNYNSVIPPIFLFISLDTTRFADAYQITTTEVEKNTIFSDLEIFEHAKVTIPIKVRYNAAAALTFTSSGLLDIPLSRHKWQNTMIPFFINPVDSSGAIIVNYPPLTLNTELTATTAFNVLNLTLLDETLNQELSAAFYAETNDGLPPAISGTYRGYFIPQETGNNVTLSANVTLYNPPNTQMDTVIGWVAQPDTDSIYKISPDVSTLYEYTTAGIALGISDENKVITIGKDSVFTIAVAPSADYDINVDAYAWMADANTDEIVKVSITNEILSSIALSSIIGTDYKLTPGSMALDRDNNLWVALHDTTFTVKVNGRTGMKMVSATPSITNLTYTTSEENFGGTNLIQPGPVDVDRDNNLWVAYTHPLYCLVEKYNGTYGTLISSIPFSEGRIPTDMLVDRNNNLWVTTEMSEMSTLEVTVVGTLTSTKLSSNGDTYGKYLFTFPSEITGYAETLGDSTSALKLEIKGATDKYINGYYLIEQFNSATQCVVEPNPLAYNFASLSSINDTVTAIFTESDKLYRINCESGTIVEIGGFFHPSYITVDSSQNVWITHYLTRVSKVSADSTSINTNFNVGSGCYMLETVRQRNLIVTNDGEAHPYQLLVDPINYRVFQHIEGIACDTADVLWVINDFEGRLYFVPTTDLALSAVTYTDFPEPLPGSYDETRKTYTSFGDWNGWRWINKYQSYDRIQRIYGSTTFDILPASGLYHIAKINEDFDAAETYKSYRFLEHLQNADNLFDQFIGQMVGDANADATTLGKLVYERIANFPLNTADVETCDITALYSICAELDIPIDDYQFLLPANLKRIFNLVSIKHKKLWGDRNKYNQDFNTRYSQNSAYGKNLGAEIDIRTYMVSAGTNLVFKQLFNHEYKLITTMVLSGFALSGSQSVYPLSSYSSSWGWGLENGVEGIDIEKYYRVYTFVPTFDNSQQEGIIDWNNPLNNLVESVSSIETWLDDNGIVDTMLDWQLRVGLGLFTTDESASVLLNTFRYRPIFIPYFLTDETNTALTDENGNWLFVSS